MNRTVLDGMLCDWQLAGVFHFCAVLIWTRYSSRRGVPADTQRSNVLQLDTSIDLARLASALAAQLSTAVSDAVRSFAKSWGWGSSSADELDVSQVSCCETSLVTTLNSSVRLRQTNANTQEAAEQRLREGKTSTLSATLELNDEQRVIQALVYVAALQGDLLLTTRVAAPLLVAQCSPRLITLDESYCMMHVT